MMFAHLFADCVACYTLSRYDSNHVVIIRLSATAEVRYRLAIISILKLPRSYLRCKCCPSKYTIFAGSMPYFDVAFDHIAP